MPSTNIFNERCVEATLLRTILYIHSNGVCNAVYFRICIDLPCVQYRLTVANVCKRSPTVRLISTVGGERLQPIANGF